MHINLHVNDRDTNQFFGITANKPVSKPNRFYEAIQCEAAGDLPAAERIYTSLMDEHFGNVALAAALGMNLAVQGKHGLAHNLLLFAFNGVKDLEDDLNDLGIKTQETAPGGKARFLRMKKSELMNAIGTTWKHENNITRARYWFERAKETFQEPSADIENNLATLYINEGDPKRALTHLETAIALDPNHAQARWNRSLSNLELGNYAEGFDEYHWGMSAGVRLDRHFDERKSIPMWDGTPGKRIIVYGEQGIGDEIMFASCLDDLIRDSQEVVFECHKKLHRLFCNSFPDIDIYGTREDTDIRWPFTSEGKQRYGFDAKVAIGDLPKFYRRSLESFPGTPYIRPTTEAELRWAQRLNELFADGKPVIGINWIGGMKKTRVEVRSLTLEQMLPILEQDAHFVSLQYTPCEDEIFEFEQKHGIQIHNWPEASYNEHYDETAGLVANLDLVITNCSSVVHLAGSMGVNTWVLTPSRPAWRYRLDLDYLPWYGSTVTLWRQKQGSVLWEPVVHEVADALVDVLNARKESEIHA